MTDSSSIYALIVTTAAGLLLSVFKAWLDYKREKTAKVERQAVAEKIDHVAQAATVSAEGVAHVAQDLAITKVEKAAKNAVLDAKLDAAVGIAVATHKLVNGKMAAQLQKNATLARKLADVTQDPNHIIDAAAADKALADHLASEEPS